MRRPHPRGEPPAVMSRSDATQLPGDRACARQGDPHQAVRQHQAVPVELCGRDRITALQDEVAEIVEIDGDAEAIPDAATDLERLLNKRLAPRKLAPAVVRLT